MTTRIRRHRGRAIRRSRRTGHLDQYTAIWRVFNAALMRIREAWAAIQRAFAPILRTRSVPSRQLIHNGKKPLTPRRSAELHPRPLTTTRHR